MSESSSAYSVASLKPFWRYAVALDGRPDLPGIPYYTKAGALAFFDESVNELPWARTVLLKKRLFRRVQVGLPPVTPACPRPRKPQPPKGADA